jgi:hypothetical protein
VQADAVAVGELARVAGEVGGRHELAARDAVLCHDASQRAHLLDADLPAHPLLALHDAHRRVAVAVVRRVEPDVDAAVAAVRPRARRESRLREECFDDGFEAAPFDHLEDVARPAVGERRRRVAVRDCRRRGGSVGEAAGADEAGGDCARQAVAFGGIAGCPRVRAVAPGHVDLRWDQRC